MFKMEIVLGNVLLVKNPPLQAQQGRMVDREINNYRHLKMSTFSSVNVFVQGVMIKCLSIFVPSEFLAGFYLFIPDNFKATLNL